MNSSIIGPGQKQHWKKSEMYLWKHEKSGEEKPQEKCPLRELLIVPGSDRTYAWGKTEAEKIGKVSHESYYQCFLQRVRVCFD